MTQSSPTDLGLLPSSEFWQAGCVWRACPASVSLHYSILYVSWVESGCSASHLFCFSSQATPAPLVGPPLGLCGIGDSLSHPRDFIERPTERIQS